MRTRWGYRMVIVSENQFTIVDVADSTHPKVVDLPSDRQEQLVAKMNELYWLGAEGWEMVGGDNYEALFQYKGNGTFVFKRERD
jgi:hypothetical protein